MSVFFSKKRNHKFTLRTWYTDDWFYDWTSVWGIRGILTLLLWKSFRCFLSYELRLFMWQGFENHMLEATLTVLTVVSIWSALTLNIWPLLMAGRNFLMCCFFQCEWHGGREHGFWNPAVGHSILTLSPTILVMTVLWLRNVVSFSSLVLCFFYLNAISLLYCDYERNLFHNACYLKLYMWSSIISTLNDHDIFRMGNESVLLRIRCVTQSTQDFPFAAQ